MRWFGSAMAFPIAGPDGQHGQAPGSEGTPPLHLSPVGWCCASLLRILTARKGSHPLPRSGGPSFGRHFSLSLESFATKAHNEDVESKDVQATGTAAPQSFVSFCSFGQSLKPCRDQCFASMCIYCLVAIDRERLADPMTYDLCLEVSPRQPELVELCKKKMLEERCATSSASFSVS